jgi:hypothetical protein
MKSLYNRALGIVTPNDKLWLWDVDEINEASNTLGHRLQAEEVLVATIPSKKGLHYITRPFDVRVLGWAIPIDGRILSNVQLHKDNPTNLYIPDGAE